ncbi:hypothetical protein FGO68_gene5542 [Halteria grandinella]|uniref:Uncharacterized protein n=1 Tax=Halteria grandinella TaxID=5974 RepID=A0A8J8NH21_HALGN|nr:hypothetical protein FGO68_gene5542 [Halteria grandinella]
MMDCRVLLQEFEDLNNNPIVVYNQLSYSQQTASGVKQVPYRLSNKGSQGSGVHMSQLGISKQDKVANSVAMSSKIKTEAILAREAIKLINKQGRLFLKKRGLVKDRHQSGLSPPPEEHSSHQQLENPEQPRKLQISIQEDEGINTRIRLKSKRGDRNNNIPLYIAAGLFSHEEQNKNPLYNKSFSPKFRHFRSKNLSQQDKVLKRPSTNMDSTLTKVYTQFMQWENQDQRRIMKDSRVRVKTNDNDKGFINKEQNEKAVHFLNQSSLEQPLVLPPHQNSINQKNLQRRKLNLSVQQSPERNQQLANPLFNLPVSPITRYSNVTKQWSHAPLSPHASKFVKNETVLYPTKSSLHSPKTDQLRTSQKFSIIRNGQLIQNQEPPFNNSSQQRKLILHQIYNQRSMTAQESARIRARTSQGFK